MAQYPLHPESSNESSGTAVRAYDHRGRDNSTPPVHPKRCYFLFVVEGRYAAIPITRPTQTRASNRANPTLFATYLISRGEIRVPLMLWPTGRGRALDICVYFTRNCLLPPFSFSFCSALHHLKATNRNNHVCKQLQKKSSSRRPSLTNNHRKTQWRNQSITPGCSPSQHKQVYQACIPCRRRKVKCDLVSVWQSQLATMCVL